MERRKEGREGGWEGGREEGGVADNSEEAMVGGSFLVAGFFL